jgi:hypothetical protein
MDQPTRFPDIDAREFRAWLAFWVQLAILVLLAIVGLYFAAQGDEPGDYAIGLILAIAAIVLAALRVGSRLGGDTGGWGALLLVDNMPSLVTAIVVFIVLGLAGLIIGGTHRSVSVQDGGLALFVVCVLLVFFSMKRFFDRLETHR